MSTRPGTEQEAPGAAGVPPRAPRLDPSAGARGLEEGEGAGPALSAALADLPRDGRESLERLSERFAGDYHEDEWGFDEEFVEAVYPFLEFMYDRWWRVDAEGVRNLPAPGPALLVSNHAGIMPWDATMIAVSIMREHPLPRYPRFLVLNWAFDLPFISVLMRKVGGVVASPYNAQRLLEQDELVAVFPEGIKGAGKEFKDRYRLQRFGRGGFVELALRTGAPIVPVSVVGSEEIYPKIGDSKLLARLTGAPYFPLTPLFPWLGPLGAVPLPSKWRIAFGEPIEMAEYGPSAADDRAFLFETSERIRDTIQEQLYENLVKRGSAFF